MSAEEMLDGQCPRVDTPAHARIAHNGLLQKALLNCSCPPPDPIGQGKSEVDFQDQRKKEG